MASRISGEDRSAVSEERISGAGEPHGRDNSVIGGGHLGTFINYPIVDVSTTEVTSVIRVVGGGGFDLGIDGKAGHWITAVACTCRDPIGLVFILIFLVTLTWVNRGSCELAPSLHGK